MKTLFQWPVRCLPSIQMAGWIPFSSASMLRDYLHSTFALHQHFYRGRVEIGDEVIPLQPGDVTITPPDVVSRYELKESGSHWVVHFWRAPLSSGDSCLQLPLHIPMPTKGVVTDRMRAIAEIIDSPSGSQPERAMREAAGGALLQELILRLAMKRSCPTKDFGKPMRKSDLLLDAAKETIDRRFNETLSIAELVHASGLSHNYFSARFRERFGMTIDGYLFHRRIEAAKMLLLSTGLAIKEIAFECGIPDSNYFNKQFRRATGMSPTAYRASLLRN